MMVNDTYFLCGKLLYIALAVLTVNGNEKIRLFQVLFLFGSSAALAGDLRLSATALFPGFWWLVLLGGLAQTGIYFFYYRNLKHYEVWIVKLYLLLMPIVSCFIGVFFLGEELTFRKGAGILVVLLGAAVILLRAKLHREETVPPQTENT